MSSDEYRLDTLAPKKLVSALRIDGAAHLDDRDPGETFGWEREQAEEVFAAEMVELVDLQKRLFADGSNSLLFVLQAMDAAGKDSTIRSVFSGLNPAGVAVHPFGVPTEEERAHDYLWRIHAHTPGRWSNSGLQPIPLRRCARRPCEEVRR